VSPLDAAYLAIYLLTGVCLVLALAYQTAPVDECSVCTHCRDLRLQREAKRRLDNHKQQHQMGWADHCADPMCPWRRK